MVEIDFAETLEARLASIPDLARTLVDNPRVTIEPPRSRDPRRAHRLARHLG
jgi:hypothetical protein